MKTMKVGSLAVREGKITPRDCKLDDLFISLTYSLTINVCFMLDFHIPTSRLYIYTRSRALCGINSFDLMENFICWGNFDMKIIKQFSFNGEEMAVY